MSLKKLQVGIREDVVFGFKVTVVEPVNMYGCLIGDHSFVGPFCEIQKGVSIGKNTRIQSHCFICDLVSIGDDCFISHGVMFVNDTFSNGKRAFGDVNKYGSTNIANNVTLGTGATILPVTICSNVVIGAGSVVTKNIDRPGIYAGNPAKFLRDLP